MPQPDVRNINSGGQILFIEGPAFSELLWPLGIIDVRSLRLIQSELSESSSSLFAFLFLLMLSLNT